MSLPLQVPHPRTATLALVLAALLGAAVAAGAQGVPGVAPNKCLTGKTKCVSKKIAGLLKCRAACQKDPAKCGQPQTDCEAKVKAKFDGGPDPTKGCFAKLEAKADPAKPASVCLSTGDSADRETQTDTLVAALLLQLEIPCQATTGGFCWFFGAGGQDCDTACGLVGRTCDPAATNTFTGFGGTLAQCQAVITALGYTGPAAIDDLNSTAGCTARTDNTGAIRYVGATTTCAATSLSAERRVCACQ